MCVHSIVLTKQFIRIIYRILKIKLIANLCTKNTDEGLTLVEMIVYELDENVELFLVLDFI